MSLLLFVAIATSLTSAADFECNDVNTCSATYMCPRGKDCTIQCIGTSACENGRFICPDNYKCDIIGDGERALCSSHIYGGNNGDLTFNCSQIFCFAHSRLDCPTNADCDVTAPSGYLSFGHSYVYAQNSNSLTMSSTANWGFAYADIYCPYSLLSGSQNNCNIEVENEQNMLINTFIFAVESFTDVYIRCANGADGCNGGKMYCGPSYASSCTIKQISGKDDEYECRDPASQCQDYTFAPTKSPTASPTKTPTTPSPTTPSPTTPSPTTASPTTPSPTTSSPTTPSPTTPSPTTPSPTTNICDLPTSILYYEFHDGMNCGGTEQPDLLRDYVADSEECNDKCTELGNDCKTFIRVNSGGHGGKCFFRNGDVVGPTVYNRDDRDCYIKKCETDPFIKHTGKQCTGSQDDILRHYIGTAQECKQKCMELGTECVGFIRIKFGSQCFFRGGTLNTPYPYINRDCYERTATSGSSTETWTITISSSSWIWFIGEVFIFLLFTNICLLCYINLKRKARTNKYKSIKSVDSEYTSDSENNPLNPQ